MSVVLTSNQDRQIDKFLKEKVNLTSFLKEKERIYIISDFEGKIPAKIYEKAKSIFREDKNGFIYTGDIADYTGNLNRNDPGRYNFLKFIQLLNSNNKNCVNILGNRDINKIKVLPLLLFRNNKKWWKGTEEMQTKSKLLNDDILEISKMLLTDPIDWKVQNLTYFYSFWFLKDGLEEGPLDKWVGWKSAKRQLSVYERYLSIFGLDPSEGFMGAQNTIVCIALELGLLNDEIDIYLNKSKKDTLEFFQAANKLAALVFTVYARILDPDLGTNSLKWEYDASFYEYLINGSFVSYAFDNTNEEDSARLYLFSHGGVHSGINKDISNTVTSAQRPNYYRAINTKRQAMIGKLFPSTQSGGKINKAYDFDILNGKAKESMRKVFNEFIEGKFDELGVSDNLKIFIGISLGCYKPKPDNGDIENCSSNETPVLLGYSPIMNDQESIFNKIPPSLEIFNILGHSPTGWGYTFAVSRNNSKVICTDFSNSFLNTPFTNFNQNSFVLVLKNNIFSLEGEIYFDLKCKNYTEDLLDPNKDDFYTVKGRIPNGETKIVEDFKQSTRQTEFTITFNPEDEINFKTQQLFMRNHGLEKRITDNSKFNYHGTGIYNNFTVHIFSFLKESFKKNLIFFVDNDESQAGGKRKLKNKFKKLSTKSKTKKLSTKSKTKKLSTKSKY